MRRVAVAIAVVLFAWAALAGAAFTLRAEVDARRVGVEDHLRYTVTLEGSGAPDELDVPALTNLDVIGGPFQSSRISIVNSRMSQTRTLTWVLQPRGSLLRRLVHAMFRGRGLPIPTQVVESASVVMSMAMIDKTDALSVTARALADLYCSTNRFSILKFERRFSVEPYGLVLIKDHPLSPGARTLLAAVRAALPRPLVDDLVSDGMAR